MEVDDEWEYISHYEEDEGYKHSSSCISKGISGGAKNGRYNCTADDGTNDDGGSSFGVFAQSANTQSENRGETDTLEKVDEHEHRYTCILARTRCEGSEYDDAREEDQKDPAGFEKLHENCTSEATNRETALRPGEEVASGGVAGTLAGFRGIVDEVTSNGYLRTHITELTHGRHPEQPLALQRLLFKHSGVLGLPRHVRVRNFGDVGEEEDSREAENEDGDSKVDPLYRGEIFVVDAGEEDMRG